MGVKLRLAEYYEFVKFIALPLYLRREEYGYELQKDFAREKQVTEATLANWKADPDFLEDIRRVKYDWTRDRTPNVIASLYECCMIKQGPKGGVIIPHPLFIKLWLEEVDPDRQSDKEKEKPPTDLLNATSLTSLLLTRHEARKKKLNDSTRDLE
jgi:hypothetical protein